ncbi:MAG: hypothetical protein ACIAS6_07720 [Phycisphaerales bacterium JB060]
MSVAFFPLTTDLRLVVGGTRPGRDPSIENLWRAACGKNPRLFDGPVLAVRSIDMAAGVIEATPDRFAHVVCQASDRSVPVTILSVTGVIESTIDERPHVLLARRGLRTRSYPDMWEFAPAGGLHIPERPGVFGLHHVLETLSTELNEEVGVRSPLRGARAIGLVVDAVARSVDVVVRTALEGAAPPLRTSDEHAWECSEAQWIPVDAFDDVIDHLVGGVIEPTRAIARHLGWTR